MATIQGLRKRGHVRKPLRSRYIPVWEREVAMGRSMNQCSDCRTPGDPEKGRWLGFRFHHRHHWALGGENTADNLAVLCEGCHAKRHGKNPPRPAQPSERSVWCGMIARCYSSGRDNYHRYGGRGIRVCQRWRGPKGFEAFLKDLGPRPSPSHTLERRNVNGNYTPRNCCWATAAEQGQNRRNNVVLFWDGRRQSLAEWSAETGVPAHLISARIKSGWEIGKALSEPVKQRKSFSERFDPFRGLKPL